MLYNQRKLDERVRSMSCQCWRCISRLLLQKIKLLPILNILLLISGCESILLTSASGGIAYTFTNVAYKTVWYPIDEVQLAVHKALERMDIKELAVRKTASGFEMDAQAADLTIYIDLQNITSRSTKIAVDARKEFVLKDKATATAIIEQTELILKRTYGAVSETKRRFPARGYVTLVID